jgi:hypothetical protein
MRLYLTEYLPECEHPVSVGRCRMYKVYPRNLARASSPVISATRLGRITLNAAATRILVEKHVENVFLLWDADAKKFALKPSQKPDATAYQLRFAPENAGAGFSAKPFLRLIGYDFEETIALPTEWIERDEILEVTLPSEGFNKRYRSPRLRKSKRTSGGGEDGGEKDSATAATA